MMMMMMMMMLINGVFECKMYSASRDVVYGSPINVL